MLADTLKRLRWTLIIPAGFTAGAMTILFIYLAVYGLVVSHGILLGTEPGRQRLDFLVGAVGTWGALGFFLLAVTITASWLIRKAEDTPKAHGVAVGCVAALSQQGIVYLTTPSVELFEFSMSVALGVLGGLLGAMEAESALESRENVLRMSRALAAANDADEISAAIGDHLTGSKARSLSLWELPAPGEPLRDEPLRDEPLRDDPLRDEPLRLLSSWPDSEKPPPADRVRAAGMEALDASDGTPWVVARAEPRVREMLLIPLIAPGERRVGLLVAAFDEKKARLSRGAIRQLLTAASQATLAIERMRLAEENRAVGRESGVLKERQRLAHDLHDTLAQGFAGVVNHLSAASMARDSNDSEELRNIEKARRIARESLSETRRMIWALRPESLERDSLPIALRKLVDGSDGEAETKFAATGDPLELPPEVEAALFRVAQEALANIKKHAGAENAMLTLSYMEDIAVLDIADDGRGFDLSTAKAATIGATDKGGFGLAAMRERVETLGGELLIESAPGEGTTIAVEIPVKANRPRELARREEG